MKNMLVIYCLRTFVLRYLFFGLFVVSCDRNAEIPEESDVINIDTLLSVNSVSHQNIILKRNEGFPNEDYFVLVAKQGEPFIQMGLFKATDNIFEISNLISGQNYDIQISTDIGRPDCSNAISVTTVVNEETAAIAGMYKGGFNLLMGIINVEVKFIDWNKILVKQEVAENSEKYYCFEAVLLEPDKEGNREVIIPEQMIMELDNVTLKGFADPVLGAFGDQRHGLFKGDGSFKYNVAIFEEGNRLLNSFLGNKVIGSLD
ncbi:hypothetical protein DF185_16295 [Marinifilum breve]|uniref:DUF4249 family protein n=1 Tax=Marinifilum breve TaxID=2184082 RepID=A0A2V4A8L5_9BACT|nr:hypothetical protein [Marinifilum breve]PXX98932.1 hypothetical protein DF185_16295 [Marinifilum breve]